MKQKILVLLKFQTTHGLVQSEYTAAVALNIFFGDGFTWGPASFINMHKYMIRLANYSPYKRIIYLAIKNLPQYDKKMKIIKVKCSTSTFLHFFLQKFLLKLTLKIYVIHTIVIIQFWFCPRTLAHLQWEKISNGAEKHIHIKKVEQLPLSEFSIFSEVVGVILVFESSSFRLHRVRMKQHLQHWKETEVQEEKLLNFTRCRAVSIFTIVWTKVSYNGCKFTTFFSLLYSTRSENFLKIR